MWVVIPVKPFAFAKRRLAGVLSEEERADLARAMLRDVLASVRACRQASGILLVSREWEVQQLAREAGVEFMQERERGLSKAAGQAAQVLAAAGADAVLVVPGDVPLVTSRELDALIAQHGPAPCVTLVADREGAGTNAIAMSPPGFMPFRFGRRSFQVHRTQAEARGARVSCMLAPGLALDVDTPADLKRLLQADAETETLAFLCDRQVASRLLSPPGLAVAMPW